MSEVYGSILSQIHRNAGYQNGGVSAVCRLSCGDKLLVIIILRYYDSCAWVKGLAVAYLSGDQINATAAWNANAAASPSPRATLAKEARSASSVGSRKNVSPPLHRV